MGVDESLRAPSHTLRWVIIAGVAVVSVGAVVLFNSYSGKKDEATLQRFDAFRAAYAEKCGVPSYAGPVPDVVREDFLTSPAIQTAVDKQLTALNGGASCDDVVNALKKVDLAVPVAGAAL